MPNPSRLLGRSHLTLEPRKSDSEETLLIAHVHIMKTAGQTVCDILRNSFGHNHCDLRCGDLATVADVTFAKQFYPNLQSLGGHSIRPWSELSEIPNLRFFTFLRDPIERCLSHYQFDLQRNGRNIDFLEWLPRNANYQTKILGRSDDASTAIDVLETRIGCVGFVEDFDRSLKLLQRWSGHQLDLTYRSRNRAKTNSVKQAVLANPEYVSALHEANRSDQEVYRYSRDIIYPRLVAEFDSDGDLETPARSTIPFWPSAKRNLLYKPWAKMLRRA